MKKLKKVLIGLLTCLTVGTATVGMAACNVGLSPDGNGGVNIEVSGNQPTSSEGKEDTNVKLAVPTNIRVDENNVLRWNSVDNASSYIIVIDEQEYERNVLACDLTKILKYNGRYEIYIKAKTNDSTKVDGDFSEPFFFDYEDGIEKTDKTEVGTFGQFEDLFTQEAYIGYGYDVINSSYVNSREVKTNYPIFDRNQLMGKRLLMTNERETQDEYTSGNSIASYQQAVESKLSTKIKGGKVFSGSLGTKFSRTTKSTVSALFYEYRHSTVAYTLVLQCDFNEYRDMLTDAFKRDLMTLDVGTLFQRYGTHVITSALMGGRFDLNYTMLSDEEIDMSKLAVDLDTTFKAWSVNTTIDVSVSVETTAKDNGCTISSYSTVAGGDYTQMNNEKAILANYQKWIASIEQKPALIGIKDINSLVPIWELLGDSNEEQARKAELQTIFEEYGQEAYEDLLESYEVNPPIRPMGVNVTVKDKVTGDVVDTNDVWAGSTLFLDVKAEPELAIISKSVTVDKPEYVTYNSADSSLLIKPETPHNEVINITVDVGYGVSAVIPITVGRYYTVTFESNDGTEIASCTVRHGKQLSEPAEPIKTGFVFKGWYTDPDFAEDTLYVFGEKSITSNMTLYAKWEVYYPTISFVHNIVGCETLTDNVRYNNAYAQPALTNEGHNLLGYYSNEEMTSPFDFTQLIKGNTKIYVKWQPKEFTVTFDSQGGSSVSDVVGVKWGTKLKAPIPPTKTGYVFSGWYRESVCMNVFDFYNDVIKADTTLYASWLEDPIYIEFESDGQKAADERMILKGGNLGDNLPTLGKLGYTFGGWYTSAQCLENEKVYANTSFTESCTLYAKWTINTYTITYVANGGTLTGEYTTTYQIDVHIVFATVIKKSHTFTGWYEESELANPDELSKNPRNVTLVADFILSTYTIQYRNNGGVQLPNGNYPVEYQLNDEVEISDLKYATYSDYNHFLGWYQDENFNEKLDINSLCEDPRDITLYAKWDLCSVVYNNIHETPQITCGGRVIVDWSTCSEGEYDYVEAVNVSGERYGGGNDNLDIARTQEVIFIGNPATVYTNVRIYIVNYPDQSSISLIFDNFNIKGYIWSYSPPETLYLNLKCVNNSSITAAGQHAIYKFSDVTITGSGTFTLTGYSGADATAEASSGEGGKHAICDVENLVIDMQGGTLIAKGGSGGNASGYWDIPSSSRDGYGGAEGGAGRCAIYVGNMYVKGNSTVIATGGNGGRGGDGEASRNKYWGSENAGGNGGRGGKGGDGITVDTLEVEEGAFVFAVAGDGGDGGNGGAGDTRYANGTPGDGGDGGAAGTAVAGNVIGIVDETDGSNGAAGSKGGTYKSD